MTERIFLIYIKIRYATSKPYKLRELPHRVICSIIINFHNGICRGVIAAGLHGLQANEIVCGSARKHHVISYSLTTAGLKQVRYP